MLIDMETAGALTFIVGIVIVACFLKAEIQSYTQDKDEIKSQKPSQKKTRDIDSLACSPAVAKKLGQSQRTRRGSVPS